MLFHAIERKMHISAAQERAYRLTIKSIHTSPPQNGIVVPVASLPVVNANHRQDNTVRSRLKGENHFPAQTQPIAKRHFPVSTRQRPRFQSGPSNRHISLYRPIFETASLRISPESSTRRFGMYLSTQTQNQSHSFPAFESKNFHLSVHRRILRRIIGQ